MPSGKGKAFEYRRPLSARQRNLLGALSLVIVLAIWCILSYGRMVQPLFLPTPGSVLRATIDMFREGSLLGDIGASLFRVVVGFAVSAAVAIPLGVLMGSFPRVDAFFAPLTAFFRYMPVAGFIPLLILWLGIGHLEKIALLFIGVFFYLLAMVVAIVSGIRRELVDAALTLGASKWQVVTRVVVPAASPGIFDSLRTMIGAAWSFIVVAELVAAQSGLGRMIMDSQRFLDTPRVVSGILIIGAIGVSFDACFRIARPRLFPWLTGEVIV